jgi:hypothetical protein
MLIVRKEREEERRRVGENKSGGRCSSLFSENREKLRKLRVSIC